MTVNLTKIANLLKEYAKSHHIYLHIDIKYNSTYQQNILYAQYIGTTAKSEIGSWTGLDTFIITEHGYINYHIHNHALMNPTFQSYVESILSKIKD